jgi:hypothetical protein
MTDLSLYDFFMSVHSLLIPTVWYTLSYKCYGILKGILFKRICLTNDMGETTTLALNAPNKASLRTTIPMFIVKQWGLRPGDKLDWSLDSKKNEIVILVKKTPSTKK